MDKQQIISFIENQIAEGRISLSDLKNIASSGGSENTVTQATTSTKQESSKNLTNVFYAIGATIAIVGVGILTAQHWEEIGFAGRLLVTLGIALISYVSALLLNKPEQKTVSQVLFTVAAALSPLSAHVLLDQANMRYTWDTQVWVSLVLLVIFATALIISKRNILVLISVFFGSWTYYALIMKFIETGSHDNDIIKWATMFLGIAYLCISYGYGLRKSGEKEDDSVQNILSGLGTLAILGAGITMGDFFDLIYILILFAAFYGSVYLKSKAMLLFASVFLMAHIIKLTSKHFVNVIGWPIALIVVGFLIIGVGYFTYYINKKYIKNSE